MPNRDTLREELGLLRELEPLVTARQEVAVAHIIGPREQVFAARAFFNELLATFHRIQSAYRNEAGMFWQNRRGHAVVVFSTDLHLTGPITAAVFRYFLEYLEKTLADPIVIGRVGEAQFKSALPGIKFTYIRIPAEPITGIIPALVRRMTQYERITFIIGKYDNLVRQYPAEITIGKMEEANETVNEEKYIFEPSQDTIMTLFDQNIVALILEQTAGENQLAQLGSQITAMENIQLAIGRRRRQLTLQQRQSQHAKNGRKQRETLAGRSLWFKRI